MPRTARPRTEPARTTPLIAWGTVILVCLVVCGGLHAGGAGAGPGGPGQARSAPRGVGLPAGDHKGEVSRLAPSGRRLGTAPRVPAVPANQKTAKLAVAGAAPKSAGPMALKDVKTWMYQLQGVENTGAVAALAGSGYDMLVVEPTATVKGCQSFDMKGMVRRFHAGKGGRVVLAYIDIGEAESYRTYWRSTWRAPKNNNPGSPDFILRADPDGWAENFVVAYWDQRWQAVLANELVKIMNAGFDGIYLDWVDAYEDAAVLAEAKRQHVDPVAAMIDFIAGLRTTARKVNPKAVVIAQNAPYLLDEDARYANVIDGLAMEDIWFRGRADAGWNSPAGGDIPNRWNDEYSTAALVKQCKEYLAAGKPVFTVDYCLKPAHAAQVYRDSAKAGLTPLVTRVSLAKITTTPPPALK